MKKYGWAITIVCALITAGGSIYAAYASYKTQIEVEALKASTTKEIKAAELRSQIEILQLKDQLDAAKERRTQSAAKEAVSIRTRATRCDEIKAIRDRMSTDITHLDWNDHGSDQALSSLQDAANKRTSYFSRESSATFNSLLPEDEKTDRLANYYGFFKAVLEGYNTELKLHCTN